VLTGRRLFSCSATVPHLRGARVATTFAMMAATSTILPQIEVPPSASFLLPATPGFDVDTLLSDVLFEGLGGFTSRIPTLSLCKSCKKNLTHEHFAEGKKTCGACLKIHRNYMRRKRRLAARESSSSHELRVSA
jgi:hypothetical protein